MLALLPLRGWVGDAMALELTAAALEHPENAIKSVAHQGHSARATADFDAQHGHARPADCPGHGAVTDSAADSPSQASTDCNTCAACQICHLVALTPSLPQLAPLFLPAARPQAAPLLFASAEPVPGSKPPIS